MKDPSVVLGGWAGVSCWERKRGLGEDGALARDHPPVRHQSLRASGKGCAKSCRRLGEREGTGEERGLSRAHSDPNLEQRDAATHSPQQRGSLCLEIDWHRHRGAALPSTQERYHAQCSADSGAKFFGAAVQRVLTVLKGQGRD